jgi:hypothetical protein
MLVLRTRCLFVLAVVGCITITLAPTLSAQDKETKDLAKKLQTKVSLDKGIDANTTLKDALEFVADRFDLTIVLNSKAFEAVGVQKVEELPVGLKPVKDVELGKVLQKLLDPVDATYKAEKGKVVIGPKKK